MTHKLRALVALRVEHELGSIWLEAGARLSSGTKVAAELVLADLAHPADDDEIEALCHAVAALDRANA